MNPPSLKTDEIKAILDKSFESVLSPTRSTELIAQAVSKLDRRHQNFALHWVDVIAKTNTELAYQFAVRVTDAFRLMDLPDIERWIIRAMDIYDRDGLNPGIAALVQYQVVAVEAGEWRRGVTLEEIHRVLELYVQGLAGRSLKIAAASDCYTDTETLFLPHRVATFSERQDNFRRYKTTVAHLWAQTWYGTFRTPEQAQPLDEMLAEFNDELTAMRVFHALETVRLNANLEREFPGLYQDMVELQQRTGEVRYPATWRTAIQQLKQPEATVSDSRAWLPKLYSSQLPETYCYQGTLIPGRARQVAEQRMAREKMLFQQALDQLGKHFAANLSDAGISSHRPRQVIKPVPDPDHPGEISFLSAAGGQPVQLPAHLRALVQSIIQDHGRIPEDYFWETAGENPPAPEEQPHAMTAENEADGGASVFIYQEWDFRRHHYRKDWCVLRERDVFPYDDPFVARTLAKYRGELPQLRKTFEALRGENRLLKKQINGDNIDFDALVEAHADMKTGRELSERLFTKLHKHERDIAVMFMVDMSGSTKGWINDAEREALVLLCEALEILGDRYAIYGFSGMTRKRCDLYRIKHFGERYGDDVRRRIAGLQPQDYTRMGVTIRHLTKLLNGVDARTKLLITLSDGKPDDYDGYRGEYGIEDTRMSLIEAKRSGIHPFCITIDEAARDYLPHMYGAVNWVRVDDIRKLPLKVSEIYRRLTM
ncbi:MAG: hypothetical protein WD823_01370 [Sulfuricaulis sp.]|uniref:nitric oxide reductase activation protein NorD n=1 Tax=Sulfuricaulis sp. TaxID=2003553 RepID=UPI0034A24FA4